MPSTIRSISKYCRIHLTPTTRSRTTGKMSSYRMELTGGQVARLIDVYYMNKTQKVKQPASSDSFLLENQIKNP